MAVPNIENNIPNMSVYKRQDCTEEVWEKVAKFDMNNLNPAWSTLQRIPSYDVSEMICENYSDFRVIKGMPKSVFGDQFGYDMQKDIGKCMSDYYAGRISRDEVQVFFQRCCNDMRSYRTKQRQTTGTDIADNQKIAGQVYEVFAKENQRAACRANYAEGEALNGTYGGMQNDWAYYNADYYYMCVDGNQMLCGLLDEIVDKWELPPIDPDELEANSGFILDGGFDFNSGWNFHFRNQAGRASMADESVEPPKDFKFFFKGNYEADKGYSGDTGYVSVALDGMKYSRSISFQVAKDGGTKGEIYSLSELLYGDGRVPGSGKDYSRFLSNVTVFTSWYAHHTGMIDRCGNYVPKRD
ncbi:MAG: hypothetical protein K2O65_05800 [Lachnospiraceae bacterium]|nr:hypothetical protein [Lachnospiraceae bacterium]